MARILLSPPHVTDADREALLEAFDSNWIAPTGPAVTGFESDVAALANVPAAAALSSGTAGLHLALLIAGVGPGDDVVVPTATFAATANAVTYTGALPRFVDSDLESWTLDPQLLAEELRDAAQRGRLPAAVISVDLYGHCADYVAIESICERYEVPLIVDAAESLGATANGRPAGSMGFAGVYSFNGNKILSTSGGGMLVSRDEAVVERARFLSTQAREATLHYEHREIGYNYRLSNLLGALGRSQVAQLPDRIAARRAVEGRYREQLADVPGVGFIPRPPHTAPNHWLTVITLDADAYGLTSAEVIAKLDADDIEARPAWKPMHRQPVFVGLPCRGGRVADYLFATGVCLPSGSTLTERDQQRVIDAIRSHHG